MTGAGVGQCASDSRFQKATNFSRGHITAVDTVILARSRSTSILLLQLMLISISFSLQLSYFTIQLGYIASRPQSQKACEPYQGRPSKSFKS